MESRNYGLKKAKGKYISFLDSDDEFMPNKLELQVDFMENNPDYIGCACKMLIIKDDKEEIVTEWHSEDEEKGYTNLIFASNAWTSALFFNKEGFISKNIFSTFSC